MSLFQNVELDEFKFRVNSSDFCCGLKEVGFFFFKDFKRDYTKPISEKDKENFKFYCRDLVKTGAYLTATTRAGSTQKVFSDMLQETGWKEMFEVKNQNSGNLVKLWVLANDQ